MTDICRIRQEVKRMSDAQIARQRRIVSEHDAIAEKSRKEAPVKQYESVMKSQSVMESLEARARARAEARKTAGMSLTEALAASFSSTSPSSNELCWRKPDPQPALTIVPESPPKEPEKRVKWRSKPETAVHDFLHSIYSGRIEGNDRTILKPLEIDVYLPDAKLGFEINGLAWHSGKHKKKSFHHSKTMDADEAGVRLFHFWDSEINDNFPVIKSICERALNVAKPITLYLCKVREINQDLLEYFLLENSLHNRVRPCTSSKGMYYENRLLAVVSMNDDNELVNFAVKTGYRAAGVLTTFTKSFEASVKYTLDLRYEAVQDFPDWTEIGYVSPRCFYTKDYKSLLEEDPGNSDKIYDCGGVVINHN